MSIIRPEWNYENDCPAAEVRSSMSSYNRSEQPTYRRGDVLAMNYICEQVLRIHLDHVRRLGELPEEVTVIGIVPSQDQHHFMWFAGLPTPEKTLLLRIGSKYAIRHDPRSLLTIEDFDDFITRYHSLEENRP